MILVCIFALLVISIPIYIIIMGQNSACCNPTSQMLEPETLFVSKEALTAEPADLPEEFVEPTTEVAETLRSGEQYLLKRFGRKVTLESEELWRVEVRRAEGRQTVHGRGGSRSGGLSGSAVLYFPSREVFKGDLQESRPTFGVFVFRSGCFYAGEMRGFNAEGEGRFENRDSGYAYEGSWAKSLPHGRGSESYANGDHFEGELMYGAKFGTGTYRFGSGDLYEGSFYYNQSDGRGKVSYANGNRYEGEWKFGLFSGHGCFRWANGEAYEGQYL